MKILPALLSMALAVGVGVGASPPASATTSLTQATSDPVKPAEQKIEPKLQQSLRTSTSDFWIRFADQADLSKAKQIKDWGARGRFVHDTLRKSAETAQSDVVAELKKQGAHYTTYWVTNAILVEDGTADLATALAGKPSVTEIHEPAEFTLDKPPVAGPAETAPKAAAGGPEWGLREINADDVWATGVTGQGITVANLDTGVDGDHAALRNTYRGFDPATGTFDDSYNFFDADGACPDGTGPCDRNGHGSHTMGTMVGDDGEGNQIGVAPGAKWIAANGCDSCTDTAMIASAQWLLAPTASDGSAPDPAKRPQIVNNSWGSNAPTNEPFMEDIIAAWDAAGIFSVWSNGNAGPQCQTAGSPGSRTLTYSVGAYAEDGTIAGFSSRGPGQDGEIKPNVAAPGVSVRSALGDGTYAAKDGTSMAAPHVTGAVALLWSAVPALVGDIESTRALLDETAHNVDDTTCGGTADDNPTWGEGKLDALALVNAGIAAGGAGTLTGTVTNAGGAPIAGATISAKGTHSRTATTGPNGVFSLQLLAGEYDVTTSAFGYLPVTTKTTITIEGSATVNAVLTAAAKYGVTGKIVTQDGGPVPNADVTVKDTPLPAVRTGADGTFAIADVPVGDYTLDVRPNACFSPTTAVLKVDGEESLTVPVKLVVDRGGYSCAVSEGDHRRGTDKVNFTSGVWADVALPFPVAFYDGSFETLKVGLRGLITPDPTATPGGAGRAVLPFYTGRPLDLDGGGVYTAATSVDGEDAFVIEYRDVTITAPDGSGDHARINFSVTFTRSGTVIVGYGDGVGSDGPISAGSTAITGIQGPGGTTGIDFSHEAPALHDGMVVTYDMPDFGFLDVKVVDKNDKLPVAGAQVSIANGDGVVENLTTDATGSFHRQLKTGDYTLFVTGPNYQSQGYDFALDKLYASAKVDAELATSIADVAGDGLDAVMGTDQGGVGSLTLTNSGSAPMSFELGEIGRHVELNTPKVVTSTATGAKTSIDLKGWNTVAPDADKAVASAIKVGTLSGGDVLTSFNPTPGKEGEPTGLGYDGNVWVHDYDAETNTAFTVTGHNTGKAFAASWNPDFKAFDMEFDSLKGDMCQLEDSPASYIHCFDRETGKKTREVKGDWSTIQLTGLAYDAGRDVYYVGGRRNGLIGTVAGTSHPNAGQLLSYCAPPQPQVMGLAYNAASDTIWYTDRSTSKSRLLQVRPDDCSLVKAWWFPEPKANQGGGLATDVTGALWATDQIADKVLLVDVEDDLVTDLPWLSLSTTAGTLAPGESTTVKVSLSTDGVKPGVAGANILVKSDSGRQSKTYVPVTLTTTEYQVGVNAGGASFTDDAGFTWSKDQPFRKGSWGYQGRSRTTTSGADVQGTVNDALFQSQRTTPGQDLTYVFDNAPKGSYLVDLGFAEIENVKPGKRVFDVLVGGRVTQYAYDMAGAVGAMTSDVHTTVVEHAGGPLTVELKGAWGQRAPSIASLRVTLDPRGAEAPPGPEDPVAEDPEVQVAPAGRSYTPAVTTGLYRQGTTRTPWTGTFLCGVLWFGFDFPFYDTTWDGVCVSPTGMLTFDRNPTSATNTNLPTSGRGADAIYPFWDYLTVDEAAGIYIGVTEVDGFAAQIIEYRDAVLRDAPDQRVSFSVTLVEDGRIQIGYGDGIGGENPLTKGSSATIGIEGMNGAPALVHSYNTPSLTAGLSLEYTLPASGTLEGVVTDTNDGKPIAGAAVTLTAPDGGTRTVTANEKGLWKAQMLLGEHTVSVSAPNYATDTGTVKITERGQALKRDVGLATGVAKVSGGKLDWHLGPNQSAKTNLTVTNTGSAPLTVSVAERVRDGGEVADLPWLTLTGDAAGAPTELAVGESTTVTATVDTAGVDPGLIVGDVLISSNDGRNPAQVLPATLAASAYWVGVDVGGKASTDSTGFAWSADKALSGGSWGHIGGTAKATTADIAGTADDELFRTQRTGKTFSYVFKNAPAGTYVIELGFAEIDRVTPGARTFDVLVGDNVVLYDHDVQADAGRLAADKHTATVKHTGGDLTVKVIGNVGERDPMLSTLKVLEDPHF
ncbi:carboxypeptidase regulatory-like domain-containing protein [Kribbella shirazensis]|uniref:alpha-amylase n=1 Tax=Kribbella shirazensis TaxID=1105143 RepID=A0A7X5ZYP2_9ACTN|nr:carboxypeptidase regulatory-like domain-containing protein [Kribbella shirazensis]NIK54304.1 subtilisin family serine protease [Kribbella shirazensis]